MSSWKPYQLGELYDVSSGLSISKDSFGYGEVFISFKDVFYNWFLPSEPVERVNSSEKDQLTCSVLEGDVLITRTSETSEEIGMTSVALKDYPKSTFNGFCKRLRVKPDAPIEVSPKFIGYLFRSRNFRKTVAQYSTMTTRASLNADSIKRMSFLFPTFEEQKEIANILSAFDDKINNLQAQNNTLEQTAQTIFKEWFGKYQLGDELPDGWRIGKLGEISKLKSGYAFKSKDFVDNSSFKALKIKDLKGNGNVSISKISSINKECTQIERVQYFRLEQGDIVLAMSGNTTGKIGVVPPHSNEIYLNQRVGKFFINNEEQRSFLYNFLMSGNFEDKILSMGYGSAQPNISPTQIGSIDIIFPDNEKQIEYLNISNPIYDKVLMNNSQIQSLMKTRDTLLPKLMSGQIRVNEFKN